MIFSYITSKTQTTSQGICLPCQLIPAWDTTATPLSLHRKTDQTNLYYYQHIIKIHRNLQTLLLNYMTHHYHFCTSGCINAQKLQPACPTTPGYSLTNKCPAIHWLSSSVHFIRWYLRILNYHLFHN